MAQLAGLVKGFVGRWQSGGDREAVEGARRCRQGSPDCKGCEKRHLHGHYTRFIVVGGWQCEIRIPRLRCPACGRTEAVLPWFLAPRSPYPWCLRQAVIVAYLTRREGYRPLSAGFGLDWQVVWAWLDALARKAKELLAGLIGIARRYRWEPAPVEPGPQDVDACRMKALSRWKREALAASKAVLLEAYRLWLAGRDLGLSWPEPDPHGILSFLEVLRETSF